MPFGNLKYKEAGVPQSHHLRTPPGIGDSFKMPYTTTPYVETSSAARYVLRTSYVISGFLFYIMLCSAFRFSRRNAMLKKYKFTGRKSLARMTNVEAQAIMGQLAELEFPKIYYTSVQ